MEDGGRHKFSLFRGVQDKLTQNYITDNKTYKTESIFKNVCI